MTESFATVLRRLRRRVAILVVLAAGVLIYGAVGYRGLSGGRSSWVDCLYMTVITITTIGFSEVVAGAEAPAARLFTVTLAFLGVGVFTYAMSSITFFITDAELRAHWRKRRMEQALRDWKDHYIIGGGGPIAPQIAAELRATGRRYVVVAPPTDTALRPSSAEADVAGTVEGDPSDEERLRVAGIERAAGFFAAAGDDTLNIVACLTARQARPDVRIVAAVSDPRNAAKMRRAGADAVVDATTIGALRMASEMVRPAVVSFLDTMLRGRDPVLRVEELTPSARHAGSPLGTLMEQVGTDAVLLAVRHGGEWVFNPPRDRALAAGDTLILMTTPDALHRLTESFG